MQNYFQRERHAWNKIRRNQRKEPVDKIEVICGFILLLIFISFLVISFNYGQHTREQSLKTDYNEWQNQ